MATKDTIATSTKHWWQLIKTDYIDYCKNAHVDDLMSMVDYAFEVGTVYGFRAQWDSYGDTIAIKNNK